MYLTHQQSQRLIYLCYLITEQSKLEGSINEIYLLNIPNNVMREIDKLPREDVGALGKLLFIAVTNYDSLKQLYINKLRGYKDIWYFKIKSARAFFVRDEQRMVIHLLQAHKKQGQKMPKQIRQNAMNRRKRIIL